MSDLGPDLPPDLAGDIVSEIASVAGAFLPLVPLPRPLGSFSTSGPMMRAEMVTRAKAILGETEGTDGDGSPFEWNSLLSQAADDLCRGTYCFYTSFSLPLVAGQADYCVPPLFKLAGAFLLLGNGTRVKLLEAAKRDVDSLYQQWGYYPGSLLAWPSGPLFDYRNAATEALTGPPSVFFWDSLSNITLYPTPNLPAAGAYSLVTEGWATTEGQWDLDTDTCPLPARMHPTVIDGAVLLRAAQYPGKANLALIGARYTAARGKAEREAQTFARRQIGGGW